MDKIDALKLQLKMLEEQEIKKQRQLQAEQNDFDYNLKIAHKIIKQRRSGDSEYFCRRNEFTRFNEVTECLEKICNMLSIMRKEYILKHESNI